MSYLTIAQAVASNAGLEPPTTMLGSDEDVQKIGQFINEAGREIARRVDWAALRKSATITGAGSSDLIEIASDFARLARGLCVVRNAEPIRGSLTQDEWLSLTHVEGEPRYFYLASGAIGLFPYLASGETATVQYQSDEWVDGGSDAFTVNTEMALFNETLIERGAIWRWRRHAGKDFSDYLAEFEAMLADLAQFDGGVRSP